MIKTTLFQSNKTQAVRLPKDVAFPDHVKEVCIIKEGNRRVIVPARALAVTIPTTNAIASARTVRRISADALSITAWTLNWIWPSASLSARPVLSGSAATDAFKAAASKPRGLQRYVTYDTVSLN